MQIKRRGTLEFNPVTAPKDIGELIIAIQKAVGSWEDELDDMMVLAGAGITVHSLDAAFDAGKEIDGAGSLANAMLVGDGTRKLQFYSDGTRCFVGTAAGDLILAPATGNVGIGTTAPDEKLHVDGNIFVTGYSYLDLGGKAGVASPITVDRSTGNISITASPTIDDARISRKWENTNGNYMIPEGSANILKAGHTTNATNIRYVIYFQQTEVPDTGILVMETDILHTAASDAYISITGLGLMNESSHSATMDGWAAWLRNVTGTLEIRTARYVNGSNTTINTYSLFANDAQWHRLKIIVDQTASAAADVRMRIYVDGEFVGSETVTDLGGGDMGTGYPTIFTYITNDAGIDTMRFTDPVLSTRIDRHSTDNSIINSTNIPANLIANGRFAANRGAGESTTSTTEDYTLIEGWSAQHHATGANSTTVNEGGVEPGDWRIECACSATRYAVVGYDAVRQVEVGEKYTFQAFYRKGAANNGVGRVHITARTAAGGFVGHQFLNASTGLFQSAATTWAVSSADWASVRGIYTVPATTAYIRIYLGNVEPAADSRVDYTRAQLVKGAYTTEASMPPFTEGYREPPNQRRGQRWDADGLIQGASGTFVDNGGNTVTVVGGLVTAFA